MKTEIVMTCSHWLSVRACQLEQLICEPYIKPQFSILELYCKRVYDQAITHTVFCVYVFSYKKLYIFVRHCPYRFITICN